MEARKLYAKDGYSSLFEYCVKQLGLSESEAFHRMTAARIARRFPIVFTVIERREIHLTAVCLLRDYLTDDNHRELLSEASHKSKWQVKELLARRFPRPDVPSFVRKLPSAQLATQGSILDRPAPITATRSTFGAVPCAPTPELLLSDAAPRAPNDDVTGRQRCSSQAAATAALPVWPRPAAPTCAVVEPLSEARYRIQLNASAALKDKLELFQTLVSHSIPNGDVAAALERALDLALEQVRKQRFAETRKPRKVGKRRILTRKASAQRREHISNATRREVAARDGLQCSFVGEGGCRCSARAFLQIHHEKPWARGGPVTSGDLRLLCAAHNRLLAERDFGVGHVTERIEAQRRGNAPGCAKPSNPARDAGPPARDAGPEGRERVGARCHAADARGRSESNAARWHHAAAVVEYAGDGE